MTDESTFHQVLAFAADPDACALLVKSIDDPNCRVVQSTNRIETHKLLASGTFALAILKIDTHLDLLRYLLSAVQPDTVQTDLIILGEQSFDLAITSLRAGVVDYLPNPCPASSLRAVVGEALARRCQKQMIGMLIGRIKKQLEEALALLRQLDGIEQPAAATSEIVRNDSSGTYYKVGPLTIGRQQRVVLIDGRPIKVTPIEYRLLRCLSATPGDVMSCRAVALRTHQYNTSETEAMTLLKSHIRNLRRKLPGGMLVTVRGMGLMLVDPDSWRRDGARSIPVAAQSV